MDTGRNTFSVQATQNPGTDDIREKMDQIRTELGLVLKHVTRGAEKVNAVNYMNKSRMLGDDYYYEEDTYKVNDQTGDFLPNAQGSN